MLSIMYFLRKEMKDNCSKAVQSVVLNFWAILLFRIVMVDFESILAFKI